MNTKNIIAALLIMIAVVLVVKLIDRRETRTTGQSVENAINDAADSIQEGIDDAGRKIEDAVD